MLWMISTCLLIAKPALLRAFGYWSKDQHRRLLSSLLILNTYQQWRKRSQRCSLLVEKRCWK